MTESAEVYPNAPLEFVAFEVRFPMSRKLVSNEAADTVQAKLGADFPIFEPVTESGLQIGPGGATGISTNWFRFFSRSRTTAVSVKPRVLTVETTDYQHYSQFRSIVRKALHALLAADSIPVYERVGLRYIDEIRVTEPIETPNDWKPYINEALLRPLVVGPKSPQSSAVEGVLRFEVEPPHRVVMRYGSLVGEVVASQGTLRVRPKVHLGPYFLIDIDSFLTAQEESDDFSADGVLTVCDALREPVREIFEGCITEKLRDEVLRRKKV